MRTRHRGRLTTRTLEPTLFEPWRLSEPPRKHNRRNVMLVEPSPQTPTQPPNLTDIAGQHRRTNRPDSTPTQNEGLAAHEDMCSSTAQRSNQQDTDSEPRKDTHAPTTGLAPGCPKRSQPPERPKQMCNEGQESKQALRHRTPLLTR